MKYLNGMTARVLDRVKLRPSAHNDEFDIDGIHTVDKIFSTTVKIGEHEHDKSCIEFIRRPPAPDAAIDVVAIVEGIHSRLSDRHRMTGDRGLFKAQSDLVNEAVLELKPLTGQHTRMRQALMDIKKLTDPLVDNDELITPAILTMIVLHLIHGLEPRQ